MRLATPPRLVIASRGEKEAKLRDFIIQAIASSGMPDVTLVARAPDSPVAHALVAATRDITAAKVPVRVVLFELDSNSEESTPSSLLDCRDIDVRVLNDTRFASAHEQLAFGGACVWIGDCMRRDPSKRDAFEMYHGGDAKAARHAEASFAKLWAAAKPVKRIMGATVAPEVIHAGQSAAAKAGRSAPRR